MTSIIYGNLSKPELRNWKKNRFYINSKNINNS